MGYKVNVTASAERDLDEILTYIVEQLGNLDAALKMTDEVDARYEKLEENPFIYEECRDPRLKKHGYRKVVIGGYVMLYRINSEKTVVYVERYFSHLQDYADKI